MKNFALKAVKYSAFASQETNCFEAKLFYKGKACAIAKNDGHGGCTDFYPLDDALFQDAVCYAKSLPAVETSIMNEDGTPWMMEMDIEQVANELLTAWLIEKDYKRLVGKRVLWKKVGSNSIWQTGAAKNKPTLEAWIKQLAEREDTDVVLNTLPMVDALELFRKSA